MLAKLRPDSWLHREVRRKVEEVFLRNDDQAGLVAYYQSLDQEGTRRRRSPRPVRTHPGRHGPGTEAQHGTNKAVKLAPIRRDLRLL